MPALQYRALVEGLSSRMWSQYTGFLIWKTQNPWYGLRGQMYDWLLQPNAALFAIRCAAEPVHVQLCPRQGGVIQVLNSLGQTLAAKILVRAVSLDGKQLYSQLIRAQVQPQSVTPVLVGLPEAPASPEQVFFLGLYLSALALDPLHATHADDDGGGSFAYESKESKDTGKAGAGGHLQPQVHTSRNVYWVTRKQVATDAGVQPMDEYAELSTWRSSCSSGILVALPLSLLWQKLRLMPKPPSLLMQRVLAPCLPPFWLADNCHTLVLTSSSTYGRPLAADRCCGTAVERGARGGDRGIGGLVGWVGRVSGSSRAGAAQPGFKACEGERGRDL